MEGASEWDGIKAGGERFGREDCREMWFSWRGLPRGAEGLGSDKSGDGFHLE